MPDMLDELNTFTVQLQRKMLEASAQMPDYDGRVIIDAPDSEFLLCNNFCRTIQASSKLVLALSPLNSPNGIVMMIGLYRTTGKVPAVDGGMRSAVFTRLTIELLGQSCLFARFVGKSSTVFRGNGFLQPRSAFAGENDLVFEALLQDDHIEKLCWATGLANVECLRKWFKAVEHDLDKIVAHMSAKQSLLAS